MNFAARIVAVVLGVCSGATAQTQWFRCTLGGEPCGWMTSDTIEHDESRESTTSLNLVFLRGTTDVRIAMASRLVESTGGAVQELSLSRTTGGTTSSEVWTFLANRIQRTYKQSGSTRSVIVSLPAGEWVSSEEALRRALRAASAPSDTTPAFQARVLDLSLGDAPVDSSFFLLGNASIKTSVGQFECTRWRLVQGSTPPTLLWLTAEGDLIKSTADLGGGLGALEMIRSTQAKAIPTGRAPEIMIATSVTPTRAEGVSRSLDRTIVLEARVNRKDGRAVVLPSIGAQRMGVDGIVRIDIARGSPEDDGVEGDFLASVPLADTTDEAIQAFTKSGAGHKVGVKVRAEALRRAVNRHVNHKNLSTAFASASETVRARSGDCSEHAVLLAAALRCDGIPSRVVNGLIWSRRVSSSPAPAFAWHMWTQGLIDGQWWDLDATLPATRPFHAAHLAVSVNDLSRASINTSSSEMLELIGDLEIKVLSAETKR